MIPSCNIRLRESAILNGEWRRQLIGKFNAQVDSYRSIGIVECVRMV